MAKPGRKAEGQCEGMLGFVAARFGILAVE